MAFWGELYVRSTEPLFNRERTTREVAYLGWAYSSLRTPGPLIDLGCGVGRHMARVSTLTGRKVVGIERDLYSVQHRLPGNLMARGEFLALPLKPQSAAGVYAWYSTLFNMERDELAAVFRSLIKVLKPGGRLIFQTVAKERGEIESDSHFEHVFEDGVRVEENCVFDAENEREELHRTMFFPDGRTLEGSIFVKHYSLDALSHLLEMSGFRIQWVHGGLDRSPLTSQSLDLIIAADAGHG